MPPKKRIIRVCIPDVLNQPLHVVPQAIHALLSRGEGLDEGEARSIFDELPSILHKCEQAIAVEEGSATTSSGAIDAVAGGVITSCFALLHNAFLASPECQAIGLQRFLETDSALDILRRIFLETVFKASFGESAQIEVLQVVDFLCEGASTKDKAGHLFLDHLRVMLTNREVPFVVQRDVASSIINLVKCSKANKVRLGELVEVVESLNTTVDFFLQLQCVEIIFRVLRQNKALLDKLDLPPRVLRALGSLPNDSTLLQHMIGMLEEWNETREPQLILKFPALRVDVAQGNMAAQASLYFAPDHMMVLLPGNVADNLTIPYRSLRSVKLIAKDGKITFKLAELPAKLQGKAEIGVEGKDAVTVFVNQPTLQAFKKSEIHQWIISVLKAKGHHDISPLQPAGASTEGKQNRKRATAGGVSPPHQVAPPDEQPTAKRTSSANIKKALEEVDIAVAGLEPQNLQLDIQQQKNSSDKKRLSGSKRGRGGAGKKKNSELEQVAIALAGDSDEEKISPVPFRDHSGSQGHTAQQQSHPEGGTTGGSAAKKQRLEGNSSGVPSIAIREGEQRPSPAQAHMLATRGSESEVEELMEQLKGVLDAKIAAKRQEATQILVETMTSIQGKVDEARGYNKQQREAFRQEAIQELEDTKGAQSVVRQHVVESVTDLNNELQELKARSNGIRETIGCLDIEYSQQVVMDAKATEDQSLKEIKQTVEEEMSELEGRVHQRLADANPLQFLTSFVSRKIEEDSF